MFIRSLPLLLPLVSFLLTSTAFAQAEVEVEVQVDVVAPAGDATFIVEEAPAYPQAQPVPQAPQAQVVELERAPTHEAYRPAPIQPIPAPVVQRPHRLPYAAGLAIPPGGRLVERYRVGMLIAGAAMFAVPYAIGLSLLADFEEPLLAVPLLGPFLAMGNAGIIAQPFLVLDGLVQLTGVTLFIIGLTVKKRYIQMYASEDGERVLSVLPFAGQSNGVSLNLTF